MLSFSAHIGYLFTELPYEKRFAAAAAAGFSNVEHPEPYAVSAAELRELVSAHGLRYVQFAAPAGHASQGEKGIAAFADRKAEFAEGVDQALHYAQVLGVRLLHIQSGIVPKGGDPSSFWETYLANLRVAADKAALADVTILIEPISKATVPNYLLANTALGLRALAETKRDNIKLLLDAHHAAADGDDPAALISNHHQQIGHIHIADYPGRHQPGTGNLDFQRLFAAIEACGYPDSIGCEYKPAGTTVESFAWFQPYRRTI